MFFLFFYNYNPNALIDSLIVDKELNSDLCKTNIVSQKQSLCNSGCVFHNNHYDLTFPYLQEHYPKPNEKAMYSWYSLKLHDNKITTGVLMFSINIRKDNSLINRILNIYKDSNNELNRKNNILNFVVYDNRVDQKINTKDKEILQK